MPRKSSSTTSSDRGNGFAEALPEQAGLDPAPLAALRRRLHELPSENIHSVLILKGDRLVFEDYLSGTDENWGDDLGTVHFDRETLHDLRSATKSVVGSLVGIAIGEDAIPGVNTSLVDLFPTRSIPDADRKRPIQLRHLLTMTSGLEWDETITYADPRNGEARMVASGDPIGYVLSRNPVAPPGQSFNYNSGSSELLAAAVAQATGMPINEFAQTRLFAPLGITRFEWRTHTNGMPSAGSGLRLRAYDLAKIAYVYGHGGRWRGQQIIPESWARESLLPHTISHHVFGSGADLGFGYGYQWWIPNFEAGGRPIAAAVAWGNGGQCAFLFPELDLTVVFTGGNYNRFENDILLLPHRLVAEYVLPAAGVRGASVRLGGD